MRKIKSRVWQPGLQRDNWNELDGFTRRNGDLFKDPIGSLSIHGAEGPEHRIGDGVHLIRQCPAEPAQMRELDADLVVPASKPINVSTS